MQTVMTSNNAYDCVLLVDDADCVVSRWDADRDVITAYLQDGDNPEGWHIGEWPRGFDPEMQADEAIAADLRTIAAYGEVVGRNGKIDDGERRQFWGV